ncbi:hypothetical protein [Burkholderia sp. Ac-20353]|uniref:hypothetical protein n=1 Tax=Burkholderia sp. Ac-20353 TaxID=2703894 RepID=UPI00197CA8CD|nr:hypothetical protein [Burkholderia sp. Ac-20353]MBN3786039.1 hypothetical protein [Burkholderia sp. Ac-20353]
MKNKMLRLGCGLSCVLVLSACGSTPPTPIGSDTYFSSKINSAGIFGDPGSVAGTLMMDGNKFCAGMGKQFEMVTQNVRPVIAGQSAGGASITFKCVVHAGNPVMRPDNGVSTIQNQ